MNDQDNWTPTDEDVQNGGGVMTLADAEARYDALPSKRFPRRGWWLRQRSRIVPWCIRAGCWRRSWASKSGRRGNVCAVHLWQALAEDLARD